MNMSTIRPRACSTRTAYGGGINPQGEIEINFYLESDKMPAFSERRVEPDGSFGQEMAPFDEEVRVVTRHIHSKVVINYNTARALLGVAGRKNRRSGHGGRGRRAFYSRRLAQGI